MNVNLHKKMYFGFHFMVPGGLKWRPRFRNGNGNRLVWSKMVRTWTQDGPRMVQVGPNRFKMALGLPKLGLSQPFWRQCLKRLKNGGPRYFGEPGSILMCFFCVLDVSVLMVLIDRRTQNSAPASPKKVPKSCVFGASHYSGHMSKTQMFSLAP